MNVIFKTGAMLSLIATMLVPLGFYDSISQANAKSDVRLSDDLVEMVTASERAIKRNIEKLTTLSSGLTLYRFQYKNDPTTYVGLMADDLVKNSLYKPYVISMGEGHYVIHYEKLGLHIVTLDTWEKEGLNGLMNTRIAAQKIK